MFGIAMGKKGRRFGFFNFEISIESARSDAPERPIGDYERELRPYVRRVMDVQAAVYALSMAFSPPAVDLRKGEIADAYGDESYATRPIRHVLPQDPTAEDFAFYRDCYPYMEPTDLLFYFYSVSQTYPSSAGDTDGFFYCLDGALPELLTLLNEEQRLQLFCGLLALCEGRSPLYDDGGLANIRKFLGVTVDEYVVIDNQVYRGFASCTLGSVVQIKD